ncbi:MAG: type VI secretion system ATPase TssH [Myxococcales bacterium]|nr:type VI secretion system ATPase TssH [Myxococcales bacterium]
MRVDPKTLVRRLNPATTRMLEGAVGHAAGGQFYEITCEHLLLKVLESADGDAELILGKFGQRRLAVAQRVQRALERMKTGNAGRPVFSESLFQWMEDAWVVASLNFGATQLRSGHLLLQFIDRPSRYSGDSFPELETIAPPELRKQFEEIVASSAEQPAAAPAGGGPAAAGGGGGGADGPTGEEALKRFTTSFTASAKAGKVDPIFGRHAEIRQLIDILARRRKNNPIIVGEPGVGKSALVEGLAIAIANGDVPDMMKDVDLLGLDLGALNAGASVKGEFEKRLKGVINEIKASPRNIVLFIDEAHTLVGGGGGAGGNDAANLLKPALARGELKTIAATTWSEYKKYFEKDAALERRFQPVKVDEPSEANAVVMMRGLIPVYEKAHGVTIRDEAVVAAVALSHRYVSGRQLPDKSIDLLDTAAANVKIEQRTRPPELVALDEELASGERAAVAQRRDIADGAAVDLEGHNELLARIEDVRVRRDALQIRWENEKEAVERLMAARQAARSPAEGADVAALTAAVTAADEALRAIVGTDSPLIHTEVDPDAVARIVERWTGVPVSKMRSSTIGAVLKLEEELAARVRGQDDAMKVVAETVRMSHAGVRDPNTPIGVLLFVGPSGVGKTETALALADMLYGGERFVTSINMSEFQEKHTVSRLVGSPPGYVGYGEGGVLTEAVRQRPYSVVLLDECEKADLDVMNLFYQVFDKGILNDGEGRAIDFRNTVVILTSNLATAEIMSLYDRDDPPSSGVVVDAIRPILAKHFKPALLGRMTIVPYRPISQPILRDITRLKLGKLARRLQASHRVAVEFAPELVEELARRCTDPGSGARNVDHILRSSLMPEVARALLQRLADDNMTNHLRIELGLAGDWQFIFTDV